VLVAEDNVVNQKVAVRMLEKLGIRPDLATDGREAVEMFGLVPYDLIFMDCQMPEIDGYAAAREIRRMEGPHRRVAIVAMTAEVLAGLPRGVSGGGHGRPHRQADQGGIPLRGAAKLGSPRPAAPALDGVHSPSAGAV